MFRKMLLIFVSALLLSGAASAPSNAAPVQSGAVLVQSGAAPALDGLLTANAEARPMCFQTTDCSPPEVNDPHYKVVDARTCKAMGGKSMQMSYTSECIPL